MNTTNQHTEETATSPKAEMEAYRAKEQSLEKEIERLQQELDDGRKKFVDGALAKGWKKFDFFSSYNSADDEFGVGSIERFFLFHPSVDISRWDGVRFSHGHLSESQSDRSFNEWLSGLPIEHYIEL